MAWLNRLLRKSEPTNFWQLKDEQFILAINSIKTLQVTASGGMSIDPEEIRDKVIQKRQRLKYLVRRAGH